MDKETARQKAAELQSAVDKAYEDVVAGKITGPEFDQIADNAAKDMERVGTLFKSRQYANQFNLEPDGATTGKAPQQEPAAPAVPEGIQEYQRQYAKMFEAAKVRRKETASFNFGLKSWYDRSNVSVKTQGIAGLSGEATSGTSSPAGLEEGAYFLAGTVGPAVTPEFIPGIVELRMFPTVIESLFPSRPVSSPVITYLKEDSWTNAAAATGEAATKPTSTHGLKRYTEECGKIANLERITDEAIQDAAYIWSLFQQRLVQGVQRQSESELLAGGGYPGVNGLLGRSANFTKPQTVSPLSSVVFPAAITPGSYMAGNTISSLTPGRVIANADTSKTPTGSDIGVAMLKMITDIRINTLFEPDAIVINPLDYQTLRLATDNNGQYYGGSMWGRDYGYPNNQGQLTAGGVDSLSVWGMRLQTTPHLLSGLVLVGDFADAGFVATLGGMRVDVTNLNGTDFEQNLWTARAERRLGLVIERENLFELAVIQTSGSWSS